MLNFIEITEYEEKDGTFPCISCGLCCKNLPNTTELAYLNRGDGICNYLNLDTNLCSVYESRPIMCRIEDYYRAYLVDTFQWDDFVNMNLEVCKQLQSKDANVDI